MASSNSGDLVVVDPEGDLMLKVGRKVRGQKRKIEDERAVPNAKVIKVSSKILTISSPVLKAMLTGNSREGQPSLNQNNPPTLELPEDAPEYMEALCKVLHYHPQAAKRRSFSDIQEIALISDKYQCGRVLAPWFHRQLHLRLRELCMKKLAHAVNAAYLFDDKEAFYMFTQAAIKYLPRAIKNVPFAEHLLPCLKDKLIGKSLFELSLFRLSY